MGTVIAFQLGVGLYIYFHDVEELALQKKEILAHGYSMGKMASFFVWQISRVFETICGLSRSQS